tara:strand:- start:8359 stop:8946 length:588 start_codon:yes stop_codon:yes gene_type:complete
MKLLIPWHKNCPLCHSTIDNPELRLNGVLGIIDDSKIKFRTKLRHLKKNKIISVIELSLDINSNDLSVNFLDKNTFENNLDVNLELLELYKKYNSNLINRLYFECSYCFEYRWTSNSFNLSLKHDTLLNIEKEVFDIVLNNETYYVHNFFSAPKKWTEIKYCKGDKIRKSLTLPYVSVDDKEKIINKIKLLLPFY